MIPQKHPIRLIALDLDGTLFSNEHRITPRTREKIKEAVSRGIPAVISTGRPYVGLPLEDAKELGIRYAITANGAAVYEIPGKKCLYEKCMGEDLSLEIIKKLLEKKLHIDAFFQGEAFTQTSTLEVVHRSCLSEHTKNYIFSTRKQVTDLYGYVKEHHCNLQKATLNFEMREDGTFTDREETKALLLSYPRIQTVCGGNHNLEFTAAGVTKAKGLRFLCRHLHIPIEAAMVCGDSENDREIMKAAGFAVAMGNADEEIKKIADYVTASNNEDGVGAVIEKFVILKN